MVQNGGFYREQQMTYLRPIVSEVLEWDRGITPLPPQVILGNTIAFELRDGQTRTVGGTIEIPKNIDLTTNPTVDIQFAVSGTGAGNANVRLQLEAQYIADTELMTKAADETILSTEAVTDTLNRLHTVTKTLDASLMADGDRLSFALTRIGGDAADTYTGDIAIMQRTMFTYRRKDI